RLGTGVAATNDNDVEGLGVLHNVKRKSGESRRFLREFEVNSKSLSHMQNSNCASSQGKNARKSRAYMEYLSR
ncbi:MAG: hypothetical protein KJO08_08935, partial [Gammaproteobacteria bacterium]|nr:hypothetical protein [Gammaproteobacteria bacterium]